VRSWVKCGISHLDALFTKNPRCGFLFIMYEKAAQSGDCGFAFLPTVPRPQTPRSSLHIRCLAYCQMR
jgi:hypothetical protein